MLRILGRRGPCRAPAAPGGRAFAGIAGLLALPLGALAAWVLCDAVNLRPFTGASPTLAACGLFEALLLALAAGLLAALGPALRDLAGARRRSPGGASCAGLGTSCLVQFSLLLSVGIGSARAALEAGSVLGASADGFERPGPAVVSISGRSRSQLQLFEPIGGISRRTRRMSRARPSGCSSRSFARAPGSARAPVRGASLAGNASWMAHLAITTPEGHGAEGERFARDALGLAGPGAFRAWLEDWTPEAAPKVRAPRPSATLSATVTPSAASASAATPQPSAPPGAPYSRGTRGCPLKSRETGSASYYYSYPRNGRGADPDASHREGAPPCFGSCLVRSELRGPGAEQVGWDWLALHLSTLP